MYINTSAVISFLCSHLYSVRYIIALLAYIYLSHGRTNSFRKLVLAGARVGAGLAAGDDGVEIVGQSDFKRIRIHESEDVLETDVKLGEGLFNS